jgi:hypothetical protein
MTHRQAAESLAAERYLLDEMSELERHGFEAHFFDCVECAEEVRQGALVRRAVRSVGSTAVVADGTASSTLRSRIMTVVPWAIAATLTVALANQSFLVIPSLREVSSPQVLTPVALSPATRGPRLLHAQRAQHFVSLAIDVVAATDAPAPLIYELRREPDTDVLRGTAPAPAPGLPLYLLVPIALVREPGPYLVSIRNASQPRESAIEYRFAVEP